MAKEQKIEQFKKRCREKGLKLTLQRLIIYKELIRTKNHPSADKIYERVKEQFATIALDTVHRTLLTFCEIGVASMVEGTGSSKRFDGNLDSHHHIQCIKCGKIIDFYSDAYNTTPLPVEVQNSFHILKKTMHVEGICGECRQSDQHV